MTPADPPAPRQPLRSSAMPPAPVGWPPGVTAAACLTFDMDAESAVLTADISSIARMTPMSHQAYGPLVGVPRILALLDRHGLTATFFIPGYSAHRYPEVVRAIAEAGHEIAHHSYFHENTIGTDEQTEAAMLDLGLKALNDVAGVRPAGYRAPMWELNYHTPRLLAERGIRATWTAWPGPSLPAPPGPAPSPRPAGLIAQTFGVGRTDNPCAPWALP